MRGLYDALKKAGRAPIEIGPSIDPQRDISSAAASPAEAAPASRPPEPDLIPDEERIFLPAVRSPKVRTLRIRPAPGSPLFPFHLRGFHARAGEEYRKIRTKIIQHPKQPRLIVISSASAGDGKSTNAINLAGALALKADLSVLLVDGDLRRSSVAKALNLPDSVGLADVLAGECGIEDALACLERFPNLYVLSAGRVRSNPAELLDSPRWRLLCEELRQRFRFIILDGPPIAAVADYDLLEAVSDGVILVMRVDHTNRTLCLSAIDSVHREKLLGALVNCSDDWFHHKSKNYYYYANAAQPASEPQGALMMPAR